MPPLRVLVVDDEGSIRRLIVRWLLKWGNDAVDAGSAVDALASMAEAPAEIMIVDLLMPVHDGLWLLQQVHDRWPTTVAVVISGAQDEQVIINARKLGAVAFIPKPLQRELLRQALERAIAVVSGS